MRPCPTPVTHVPQRDEDDEHDPDTTVTFLHTVISILNEHDISQNGPIARVCVLSIGSVLRRCPHSQAPESPSPSHQGPRRGSRCLLAPLPGDGLQLLSVGLSLLLLLQELLPVLLRLAIGLLQLLLKGLLLLVQHKTTVNSSCAVLKRAAAA